MAIRRWIVLSVVAIVMAGTGCQRFCDRWCRPPAYVPANYYAPSCAPPPAPVTPASGCYCIPVCPTNNACQSNYQAPRPQPVPAVRPPSS